MHKEEWLIIYKGERFAKRISMSKVQLEICNFQSRSFGNLGCLKLYIRREEIPNLNKLFVICERSKI